MPNFAIIKDGKVVNTVVAEVDYATTQGWTLLPAGIGIDCDYVDGQFIDNRHAPEIVTLTTPTKEQLMAELAIITAKIQALE
jgi:hypothetical protein